MLTFNLFYFYLIILDVVLVLFILNDKKLKLILFVIFVPIVGAIYVLRQLRCPARTARSTTLSKKESFLRN